MAELWNIPGKDRPGFWTRQLRGLGLLLVFAVGLAATTLLTGLGSLGSHTAGFRLAKLALATAVNVGLYLLAFRALTPRQIPTRQLVAGAMVGRVAWQAPTGHRRLSGRPQPQARQRGVRLLRCGPGSAVVAVPGRPAHLVRRRGQRRPRPPPVAAQPAATPLTQPDQRALVDLAEQEERRPEQSVEVTFTPEPGQPNGSKHPKPKQ
jgi:hypothetical protein